MKDAHAKQQRDAEFDAMVKSSARPEDLATIIYTSARQASRRA